MAKINVVVDTETGVFDATVNGKKVENVNRVSAFTRYEMEDGKEVKEVCCCIDTYVEDADGVKTYMSVVAKEDGFIQKPQVEVDIQSFFDKLAK